MALSNNNTPLTFEEAIARLEKNKERAKKLDEAYSVYMDEDTDFNSLFGQWFKNLGCTSKEEFDRWSKGLLDDYDQYKKKNAEQPINPENEPDIDSNALRIPVDKFTEPSLKQYIYDKRPGSVAVEMPDGWYMQYEVDDFILIIDEIEKIVKKTENRMNEIIQAYKDENRDADFEDKLLPLVASIIVWETIEKAKSERNKGSIVSLDELYHNREYLTALINGTVNGKGILNKEKKAIANQINNTGYIFSLRAVLQRLGYKFNNMGYIGMERMISDSLIYDTCYFLIQINKIWYAINQKGYCPDSDENIKKFNKKGSTYFRLMSGSMGYNPRTETKLTIAQLPDKKAKELYDIASGKKIPKEKKQKEKVPPKTPEERRDERMARQAKTNATAQFRLTQRMNRTQLVTLTRQQADLSKKIASKNKDLFFAQRQRNTPLIEKINADIQDLYQQLRAINDALNSAKNEQIDIRYQQETKATKGKGLFNLFGGGGDNR